MKADRYTILQVHFNDLTDKITAIHSLGLQWFCVRSSVAQNSCEVYVFFDKAGLNNYLSGVYDSVNDKVRQVLNQYESGEIAPADIAEKIGELLKY